MVNLICLIKNVWAENSPLYPGEGEKGPTEAVRPSRCEEERQGDGWEEVNNTRVIFDQMTHVLHIDRLPTASGLNATWLASSQSKKKGATEAAKHMLVDEDALSTRPDFLRSPEKFDHEAANAKLAKASKHNLSRRNAVR